MAAHDTGPQSKTPAQVGTATQRHVECVFELALEVFGDERKVLAWLKTPHRVLGVSPVMLMHSCEGLKAVEEELEG